MDLPERMNKAMMRSIEGFPERRGFLDDLEEIHWYSGLYTVATAMKEAAYARIYEIENKLAEERDKE